MNGIVANEITEYRYHLNQNGSITLDEYMNAEMCYVVVPEEIDGYIVTEIAEGAFENRKNILGVLLPDTITRIAEKAFFGCSNLKKIRFGNNLSWIGAEAFAECNVLENLKIPSILDYLGEYAFSLCGIKRIEILGIKDWRPNSFALCTMLKSFSIKHCSMIPEGAFKHDIYLAEVTIENHVEKICETSFYDCRSFEQIIYNYWNYSINEDWVIEIQKDAKKVANLSNGLLKNMPDENSVIVAEEDARRLERLEAIKTAELKRQKQLEQEAKERLERLKEAKVGAEERAERIRAVEQEVRERAEQIRIAELEMKRLAELEARELAEYVRLAELEAKERAELEEAERKRQAELEAEERRKRFISLMKCAKITLGYYVIDIEDESDMITAGRLYSEIRDKKILLDQMVSIFPAESSAMAEQGILPIISNNDVKYSLQEREYLHYVEYVTIYMQGDDEETIEIKDGALYITNQRIQLMTGKNVYTIPYEYLKKTVLYDVMPEIIEISSSKANFFVRTANTELTYRVLKTILYNTENVELRSKPEPMNMEELSIDFLKKADMEAYIFGIKTLMDDEMPEIMRTDLSEMIRSLQYLNIALKKYPSFEEQSYNFFSYYIPEAVKILYSYNEYEKAGLREEEKNPVYEKVMVAVRKVSEAAKQQVVEIYKKAIVDTTARAQALTEILGQDGFVDPLHSIR